MTIQYWEPDTRCRYCNESFDANSTGRPREFCCVEHRNASHQPYRTTWNATRRERERAEIHAAALRIDARKAEIKS